VSARVILPYRRMNKTIELAHGGIRFSATVGFLPDGETLEVFADGLRIGSDLAYAVDDACVMISLALQYGCAPVDLWKSMARVPNLSQGGDACLPASVPDLVQGDDACLPVSVPDLVHAGGACMPASVLGVIAEAVAEVSIEIAAIRAGAVA